MIVQHLQNDGMKRMIIIKIVQYILFVEINIYITLLTSFDYHKKKLVSVRNQ